MPSLEVRNAHESSNPPSLVFTRHHDGAVSGIICIWYDNIVFLCYDNTHFRQVVSNLNSNRKAWGLSWSAEEIYSPRDMRRPEVAENTLSSASRPSFPSFLGVKMRVAFEARPRDGCPISHLVWRCDDRFFEKTAEVRAKLSQTRATRRDIARGIGLAIWSRYVYAIPLLTIREILAVAKENAPKSFSRSCWDETSTISAESKELLLNQLVKISADLSWHQHKYQDFASTDTLRIVSDSSESHGAYVIFNSDDSILQSKKWKWNENAAPMSIFQKELLAATIAIEFAASLQRPIHIAVDNSAACFVLRRGLSLNDVANEMLARVFAAVSPDKLRVTHIRSADNAADPLTRYKELDKSRNKASLDRLAEAESGWPKKQPPSSSFNRGTTHDDDGESDSDYSIPRHREEDEAEPVLSWCDCSDEANEEDVDVASSACA